jgi:uncharacterized cupin superfamily protein
MEMRAERWQRRARLPVQAYRAKVSPVRVVNVREAAMEEGPGRDGFWFRAATLGPLLGAVRIGAGVYEARPGVPIWPYHYHYPSEEWLYVLDGAPVLRDASARRVLEAGDVVCFPAGHRGAHTIEGPGWFILFSGEQSSGPFVSVYPDSDKISVFPAIEPGGINALRLARTGSVDYWHGEGSGPVSPAPVVREPDGVAGPPAVKARELTFERGDGWHWGPLGAALGAHLLDGAFLELDAGVEFGPYRYEYGRELWLLVLAGTPTLQHADGERELSTGDMACLPDGPAGGRRVLNRGAESARVLLLWTTGFPAAVCFPETGEWVLRTGRGDDEIRLRGNA